MCSSKRIGCGTEKAYFFLFLPLYTVLLETHRTTCVYTKNLKSGLKKDLCSLPNMLAKKLQACCCMGRGKRSLSMTSRSLSDVDRRSSILRSLDAGTALTNHHTQAGPLGQFSGVASIGGSGLQTLCMIVS